MAPSSWMVRGLRVEIYVGWHLLLFRLLAPPAPQPFEEDRVNPLTVFYRRQVGEGRDKRGSEGYA